MPAKSIPALVDWPLKEARLGQPKLSGPDKDGDPLIVLTEAALERYGLPVALTDEEKLAGRIPETHKVIKQLARADCKLTKRGFGPWARIYRPAQGSERNCVQLCIPSWHALDSRHWGEAAQLPAAELARLLGVYVLVHHAPGAVTLRVDDEGPATGAQTDGSGNGLAGMRERAAALEGTIEAGPRPDGGFRVTAVLPTRVGPTAAREDQ